MARKKDKQGACELCERDVEERTVHHLTPKHHGGAHKETALLCRACHRQIHALFTNKELADHYDTLEKLKNEEQMYRFLKWIRKQSPDKKVKVKTAAQKNSRFLP